MVILSRSLEMDRDLDHQGARRPDRSLTLPRAARLQWPGNISRMKTQERPGCTISFFDLDIWLRSGWGATIPKAELPIFFVDSWVLGLSSWDCLWFLIILMHMDIFCFNRHLVAEINHFLSQIRKCSWLSVGWSTDIASKIFTVPYWFKPHHLLAKPHLLKTKYLTIEWN